jgi:uncharacterized protein (TIGR03435 family)
MDISTSGFRLTAESVTAEELIMYAFRVEDYQISGAIDPAVYDIAARSGGNSEPSEDQFRDMMQTLLTDRFGLRFHRVKKEMPVYALAVGKAGSKLKKSEGEADCTCESGRTPAGTGHQMSCRHCGIDALIDELLDADTGRPVIDRTGLHGTYDMDLIYLRASDGNGLGANISDALRNQLGMRLAPQKAVVEMLAIDEMGKPSEN